MMDSVHARGNENKRKEPIEPPWKSKIAVLEIDRALKYCFVGQIFLQVHPNQNHLSDSKQR